MRHNARVDAMTSRDRNGTAQDRFRQQPQRWRMQERDIQGSRRPVLVNEVESPLGWLKSRKDRNGRPLIDEYQFDAGERLRANYCFAHLPQRVTANWSAPAPSSDNALAAKQRVHQALRDVGPELAGVLVDVCCELKGLEEAEKEHGWPQRAGKVVLQIALTRLARHYGLIHEEDARPPASRRLRHWGSEDYRPTLDAWREKGD
jgi:hypothetical protein